MAQMPLCVGEVDLKVRANWNKLQKPNGLHEATSYDTCDNGNFF